MSKRIQWGKLQTHKGDDSEDTIRNHLSILKRQNYIHAYKHTEKHSIEDKNGVDFWVYRVIDGVKIKAMPLQVKSSYAGLLEFQKQGNIPVISTSNKYLEEELRRLIRNYFGGTTKRSRKAV